MLIIPSYWSCMTFAVGRVSLNTVTINQLSKP